MGLDLDALLPEQGEVKLNGKTILVNPPKMKDYLRLVELRDIGSKATTEDDIILTLKKMTEFLEKLVPEVREEELNLIQVNALVEFIFQMATPEETKKMQEQGISVAEKKNQALDSEELPPIS